MRLDPKFALSWALLSYVEARGYRPSRLFNHSRCVNEARQAAETALSSSAQPRRGLVAKGYYHYACLKDYDTAVRYFEQARQPPAE